MKLDVEKYNEAVRRRISGMAVRSAAKEAGVNHMTMYYARKNGQPRQIGALVSMFRWLEVVNPGRMFVPVRKTPNVSDPKNMVFDAELFADDIESGMVLKGETPPLVEFVTGVSAQSIRTYMQQKNTPSVPTFLKLCEYFDLPPGRYFV